MELNQLKRILEACLLAAAQPLSLPALSAMFPEPEQPSHEEISRAIEQLAQDCNDRGIELKEVASGFRYQVREDVHPWVTRLWTERQTKYSRALLETLALIAYRQPITRAEIEQIRGVAVSTNIVRTLEEREWVRVVGYRDVPGKPALFGTTKLFLDYFNLKSLDQLPALAEIRDIEDFEPQLALGPVAMPDDELAATQLAVEAELQSRADEVVSAIDPELSADSTNHASNSDEYESAEPSLMSPHEEISTTEQIHNDTAESAASPSPDNDEHATSDIDSDVSPEPSA